MNKFSFTTRGEKHLSLKRLRLFTDCSTEISRKYIILINRNTAIQESSLQSPRFNLIPTYTISIESINRDYRYPLSCTLGVSLFHITRNSDYPRSENQAPPLIRRLLENAISNDETKLIKQIRTDFDSSISILKEWKYIVSTTLEINTKPL